MRNESELISETARGCADEGPIKVADVVYKTLLLHIEYKLVSAEEKQMLRQFVREGQALCRKFKERGR
jgi:hypothetical protein